MRYYEVKDLTQVPTWMSNKPIGDQVRIIRESLGMTQEQLAERSGLAQSVIADIERGRRKNLQTSTVQNLAAALNCVPLFQIVPQRDISQILDEKSTQIASKIVSATSGSAAIEMQLPDPELIREQTDRLKKDILEHHRSWLWQL